MAATTVAGGTVATASPEVTVPAAARPAAATSSTFATAPSQLSIAEVGQVLAPPQQVVLPAEPSVTALRQNQDDVLVSSDIVWGQPIADGGMGKLVRRVVVLAAIGATFYICHFIINLMRGSYNPQSNRDVTSLWAAVSTLLIELSIPACGYSGAVYGNRQMTCCFCSCNLFISIISIMSFIRLNIQIGEIDRQCDQETNPQTRRTCEVWVSDGPDKYLMLGSTILIILIGALAFWFGNSLYNRLAQDFVLSLPPATPLVGEVIALGPEARAISGIVPGSAPRLASGALPIGISVVAARLGAAAEDPGPITIVNVVDADASAGANNSAEAANNSAERRPQADDQVVTPGLV